MRYGLNGNDWQLRLVRKGGGFFKGAVHERIEAKGPTTRLKNPLAHLSTATVSDYMRKLNQYSNLEAGVLSERDRGQTPVGRGSDPGKRMKLRPLAVFFYLTFWKRALLDGLEGFFLAVFSAYYEFVRFAKHWEMKKLVPPSDPDCFV